MSKYIGGKLITGSIWMIASRFSLRGLGFINTIVLARILTPEDFGLVSLAMLSAGLITIFSDIGLESAILRRPKISKNLIDTAWTIGIIISLLLSSIIFAAAPLAVLYFNEPRIEPIMQLIAIQPILNAFNNIGFILYSKELEFNKVFFRSFISKLLGVMASIAIAFWLKNYWALPLGMLSHSLITTGLSYILHPYRPQFCLSASKELRSDSTNFLSKNIATFLKMKADEIVVGKIGGATNLGGYYVSKSIASMLTVELMQPIGNALLPGYTQMLDEPERLKTAFCKVLQVVSVFAFAFGFGLAAISESFVSLVFGYKWLHIVPFLKIFAFGGLVGALQSVVSPILIAKGKLKEISVFTWFNLICFLAVLWPVAQQGNLYLIAKTLVIFDFFMLLVCYVMLIKLVKLSIFDLVKSLARPFISALIMLYGIYFFLKIGLVQQPVIVLACSVLVGALIFISSLFISWFASGRPDGAEKIIFQKLRPE